MRATCSLYTARSHLTLPTSVGKPANVGWQINHCWMAGQPSLAGKPTIVGWQANHRWQANQPPVDGKPSPAHDTSSLHDTLSHLQMNLPFSERVTPCLSISIDVLWRCTFSLCSSLFSFVSKLSSHELQTHSARVIIISITLISCIKKFTFSLLRVPENFFVMICNFKTGRISSEENQPDNQTLDNAVNSE